MEKNMTLKPLLINPPTVYGNIQLSSNRHKLSKKTSPHVTVTIHRKTPPRTCPNKSKKYDTFVKICLPHTHTNTHRARSDRKTKRCPQAMQKSVTFLCEPLVAQVQTNLPRTVMSWHWLSLAWKGVETARKDTRKARTGTKLNSIDRVSFRFLSCNVCGRLLRRGFCWGWFCQWKVLTCFTWFRLVTEVKQGVN